LKTPSHSTDKLVR